MGHLAVVFFWRRAGGAVKLNLRTNRLVEGIFGGRDLGCHLLAWRYFFRLIKFKMVFIVQDLAQAHVALFI